MTCRRAPRCQVSSVEKLVSGYTCPIFEAVTEAIYRARIDIALKLGPLAAAQAIRKPKGESDD